MNDLFFGYDLRDYTKKDKVDIGAILARHVEKYGKPPSILINKTDSESIPENLGAQVKDYILPHSILLEITEVMSPDEYPLFKENIDND